MLETILKLLYSERLDKQIVKRIPYFLLCYLILYLIFFWTGVSIIVLHVFIVCALFFILFLILNSIFNYIVNKNLKNSIDFKDFSKFIKKISSIIDGVSSFNKDVDITQNKITISIAILSGLCLFIFHISILSLIFYYLQLNINIHVLLLIITSFYLYQDVTKLDFYDKSSQSSNTSLFIADIMEMYTVTNTMKPLPFGTGLKIAIYFVIRLFSPLLSVNIPKIYYRQHIFYRYPELNNFIEEYLNKDEGIAFIENKEVKGFEFNKLKNISNADNLSTIFEQSPKTIFPYLYQADFSNSGKDIKYTIMQVVKKSKSSDEEDESLGYIFIHLFNSAIIIKKLRGKSRHESTLKNTLRKHAVYSILFIGERNTMQYIESLMKTNTQSVPPAAMNIEYDE